VFAAGTEVASRQRAGFAEREQAVDPLRPSSRNLHRKPRGTFTILVDRDARSLNSNPR